MLWLQGDLEVEVLRSEVDGAGYDLVLEAREVTRHIQLKAMRVGGKRSKVDINTRLLSKASGCVIWFYFDPRTLRLGPFLWFGGSPGTPLPDLGDRVSRQTRANATGYKPERQNLRVLLKSRFDVLPTVEDLVNRLFGSSGKGTGSS